MDAETLTLLLRMARVSQRVQRQIRGCSSLAAVAPLLAPYHDALVTKVPPLTIRRTQQWLQGPQRRLLHWFDADYPEALRTIHQPPLVLFIAGNEGLLQRPQVAIVGSRKADPGVLHLADYFARTLSQVGLIISSGLAQGIDTAAHKSALDHGNTIAVLGTGPDVSFPKSHRHLQQRIEHQGLLVSEFAPGTAARRDHFPRRNRILTGLSDGVLVIASQLASGTLITARLANEQNRPVMVVPGSIWDAAMNGNLHLIREGAALVRNADDVLQELQIEKQTQPTATTDENKCAGSLANTDLLANVGNEATSIDTIVARSGLPVAMVTEQLVLLELEGRVASVAGGYIKMGRR